MAFSVRGFGSTEFDRGRLLFDLNITNLSYFITLYCLSGVLELLDFLVFLVYVLSNRHYII